MSRTRLIGVGLVHLKFYMLKFNRMTKNKTKQYTETELIFICLIINFYLLNSIPNKNNIVISFPTKNQSRLTFVPIPQFSAEECATANTRCESTSVWCLD